MIKKILVLFAIVSLIYLIILIAVDERMQDGALYAAEMHIWEFPIVLGLPIALIGLWVRGVMFAIKIGGSTFWFALCFWPFGVFLAF